MVSIELQLLREEIVWDLEKRRKRSEHSEVQNIQIADGHVPKGTDIPILMHLPKVFCCSSAVNEYFGINFSLNIVIRFESNMVAVESIPLKLHRE